jgi:1,4-alpha-glucan branching enzyme
MTTEHLAGPSGEREEPRLVRLGYFDPGAREVFVVGSFNGWNPRATPLVRGPGGAWSVALALAPGEYRYRLFVDGEWKDDPEARRTALNPYGGFDAVIVA